MGIVGTRRTRGSKDGFVRKPHLLHPVPAAAGALRELVAQEIGIAVLAGAGRDDENILVHGSGGLPSFKGVAVDGHTVLRGQFAAVAQEQELHRFPALAAIFPNSSGVMP